MLLVCQIEHNSLSLLSREGYLLFHQWFCLPVLWLRQILFSQLFLGLQVLWIWPVKSVGCCGGVLSFQFELDQWWFDIQEWVLFMVLVHWWLSVCHLCVSALGIQRIYCLQCRHCWIFLLLLLDPYLSYLLWKLLLGPPGGWYVSIGTLSSVFVPPVFLPWVPQSMHWLLLVACSDSTLTFLYLKNNWK